MNLPRDWHYAGADEHGFILYDTLRREAAARSEEQFLADFPVPGVMVIYRGLDQAESEGMDPSQSGVQLLTVSVRSASVMRYLSRVAFVCKRPGNPYAHLISIGRSTSNDITVAVDSVSKVHGYFVIEEGEVLFTDHESTNGSRLNGHRLEPKTRHTVRDGDIVQLGLEVMLEFMTPATMYRRASS
ncbi:MAG: FHA domain-containing protein [Acidobacteriota bacterium]